MKKINFSIFDWIVLSLFICSLTLDIFWNFLTSIFDVILLTNKFSNPYSFTKFLIENSTIVSKIKNRKPNVINFNSGLLHSLIEEFLSEENIYIKESGKVFYDEATGYNELDKSIESSNVFELIVGHAYNHIQAKILDESGYTYEKTKLEDNKVRFIVNS